MLDRQIAQHGETVILRRVSGTQLEPYDARVRVKVIDHAAAELQGKLKQGQRLVVLSPSDMQADRWDWPPRQDDQVILDPDGAVVPCNVLFVEQVKVGDTPARWHLTIQG